LASYSSSSKRSSSESGKTITLTLKGVKSQQTLQWHYFNSDCMEIFLEKFQAENTDKIHIVQLDNASIHMCEAVC
jgi:hypothetical protein